MINKIVGCYHAFNSILDFNDNFSILRIDFTNNSMLIIIHDDYHEDWWDEGTCLKNHRNSMAGESYHYYDVYFEPSNQTDLIVADDFLKFIQHNRE